ncbi:MAG: hypothetical protein HFE84_06350 [Lachnospiraceae bacterium]|nr:hypothetical protein [Lachnospiraceae bacterium]
MVSIPYLKKAVFTGSHKGMCFLLRSQTSGEDMLLQAAAWPGPFNFSATDEEKKVYQEFAFSEEGLLEAVDWLNESYEKEHAL